MGQVRHGEFFEAGSDPAEIFEPVEVSLDEVSWAIDVWINGSLDLSYSPSVGQISG
jgi:hypothetical protein